MEEAKELHRKVVKKFQKRRIITKGIDDIWAADLLIMNQYSTRNKGYNYIFNVIDTFSKFLFAVPLKKKSGEEVAVAFSKILKTSNRCPTKLHVDRGKEFVNKEFQTVLKENKIEMYHTFNEEKSAIAERVNRTINEKLKLHFEVTQKFRWIDALEGIVKEYNENDVHRSIGTTPVSVTSKNENEVREKLFPLNDFHSEKPTFTVGQPVRIPTWKNLFGNKYRRNWTKEIFYISKICYTDPITYEIKDNQDEPIHGHFYKQELQKTNNT
ncbi:hypothetical protein V9T40_001433 [Parthenolecanium corni]|uniref:Integrase catalytic domain-containing protein n=1 Tax=Parthenolecanium corni TaxID=536013 RepID=A0AAN9THY1_9HEMI